MSIAILDMSSAFNIGEYTRWNDLYKVLWLQALNTWLSSVLSRENYSGYLYKSCCHQFQISVAKYNCSE